MFQKPFKVKSHSAIKGSEKKKLRSDLNSQFPNLSSDDLNILMPNKTELSSMKLCTHSGNFVTVYFVQKNPMIFEVDKVYYPTVYTLWKLPTMLHKFTTWPNVFEKLSSGADLMLPGIITEKGEELQPEMLGNLQKGDLCCVNLANENNINLPIAVGIAAMSSREMYSSGKKGKGVLIKHIYLDHLWAQGDKSHPPTENITEIKDEINELIADNKSEEQSEGVDVLVEKESNQIEKSPTEVMDDLLVQCFLHVWKLRGKKIELPLLTSTFYKNYMIPLCPKDRMLDVKKSSFKKMSTFLQNMQERGIIQVKELSKGVESIVGVDLAHSDIRGLEVIFDHSEVEPESNQSKPNQDSYQFPQVTELFMVTADVLPLFKTGGCSKGSTLTVAEIRQIIKNYVTVNNLQDQQQRVLVNLNDTLRNCLRSQEMNLKWDELTTTLLHKMSPAFQLKFNNQEPIIKKGKLEPIQLSISQRAANKKVTLINNLHIYNIDPEAVARSLQIGVAASTSVSPAPNKKDGQQVLVQGNQIKFISKLLLDDYRVPSRYIKGLELAPKQNKKR